MMSLHRIRHLWLCLALFCVGTAGGQTQATPAAEVRWQVVHAGQLLDRPGRPPRAAATLVLRNEQVFSVHNGWLGAKAIDGVPPEATVLDLRENFVLPGLIDSHVHLSSDKAGIEAQLEDISLSAPAVAYEAAVNARRTLAAGFTTVRNLGDGDGVTLALRDAIAAGKLRGPRIVDAGRSISTTSGHMDGRLGYREEFHEAIGDGNLCDGIEACRRAVRRQIARGADVIKMATTGGVNSRIGAGLGQQMFLDEAQAIVQTAHLYGRKVAVHAHGADGILVALQAGADSIEHGTLVDAVGLEQMRTAGVWYVPTLSTVNGYLERLRRNPGAYSAAVRAKIEWRIGITGKAFRQAHKAGVRIAFGTDAGVSLHGCNADEFELMLKHGMDNGEAIVAATTGAATLLGLEQEIGSLEPGRRADLVALAGDPLKDIQALKQVRWVMTGGQSFDPQADQRRDGCAPRDGSN